MAVRDEQSDEGDHDGCDRYPEPGTLLSKYVHSPGQSIAMTEFPSSAFLVMGLRLSRRTGPVACNEFSAFQRLGGDFGIFRDGLESVDAEGF